MRTKALAKQLDVFVSKVREQKEAEKLDGTSWLLSDSGQYDVDISEDTIMWIAAQPIKDGELLNAYFLVEHELGQMLEKIKTEAESLFVSIRGNTDYVMIDKFSEGDHPYRAGPGETDSCGWLTGVIHTPIGKIVFG